MEGTPLLNERVWKLSKLSLVNVLRVHYLQAFAKYCLVDVSGKVNVYLAGRLFGGACIHKYSENIQMSAAG